MLNVLVGVGVVVALSGALLRRRANDVVLPAPGPSEPGHVSLPVRDLRGQHDRRRVARPAGSAARSPPARAALLLGTRHSRGDRRPGGALGLLYGWLVSPRLEAILPFWLAALVLGILAYPRGRELEDLDAPMELHGKLAP